MIASKVTVSQETREKLLNPVLSIAKKSQLREAMVKESIRKAVGGIRTKQELIAAAGYDPSVNSKGYAAGLGFLSGMIKRGSISHEPTNTFKKVWTVTEDVKTKVSPTPKEVAQQAIAPTEPIVQPVKAAEPIVELKPKEEVDKAKLLDMAKDFAWRENSDSLRDFISYMQNAIK